MFNKNEFSAEEMTIENKPVNFRAYRNLVYVKNPVCPEYQQMNIFVPEAYYNGESINGYNADTAPIFMPNGVGGYMPGKAGEAGLTKDGRANTILRALAHGYVVASPALRGRSLKNEKDENIGKAPACVIDYKCAVRFLRLIKDDIPGDTEKIITNGTSAGGALSSLMGATGNHKDYEIYIKEIGGADERDDIFAASCYCPITNLENADMAYEWQFNGHNECHGMKRNIDENGNVTWEKHINQMSDVQIKASNELFSMFPQYLNSLGLKDEEGNVLNLDNDGNGTFKEYVKGIVRESAQKAVDNKVDISDKTWIEICDGKVTSIDFDGYVSDITRMKPSPAFDRLDMDITENHLFGTTDDDFAHFTKYSVENSLSACKKMADETIIRVMNPMNYISDKTALTAKHWRIRHGERDRDTSLAISAMLTLKLQNNGCSVDYHSPWDIPHAGDYDLDELFNWIDTICRIDKKS
ncbi:MAG: alpha/beta hydrolase [Clostridia bacterium]|nr:alpha/beta hydrolase [Clostridia bacterium]